MGVLLTRVTTGLLLSIIYVIVAYWGLYYGLIEFRDIVSYASIMPHIMLWVSLSRPAVGSTKLEHSYGMVYVGCSAFLCFGERARRTRTHI